MIIGLLGKANVGKSTFFNAATDLSVQVANFPFTTIAPNVGIAFVRINCVCKEMGVMDNPINSRCINGVRFIPVKLIDIAGLVPGAHSGRGLGNKFLDDSRQANVIIHVVDISGSTDEEGKTVSLGSGDPLSDIKFVENEFDLWIHSLILRDWDKVIRESENLKQNIEHTISKRLSGLSISEQVVKNAINTVGLIKKPANWDENDLLMVCKQIRITSKPIVIAANKADLPTSESNISKLKGLNRSFFTCVSEAELLLKRALQKNLIYYLPGDPEFEIKNPDVLSKNQLEALHMVSKVLRKYGSTGIQNILNHTCFKILNNIVVYPVEDEFKFTDKKGNVLPDARIVSKDITAKELAHLIHNELGKGFLYAIDARSKQRIGAEHVLKNNDIVKIVSTTSRN
ncbi:MAG: redox-regulated ATPase YchF [Nitrosopumilus sp.]|nr:redox-regulated ATPase YchF [Nitrosopumilus sp.]